MARGLSGERIEKILLHNICKEISLQICNNPPWYSGQYFRLLSWMPGFTSPAKQNLQINFFSFSSCCNHQTFLIRLAIFKIPQIPSPERASERKGMSTVERFIWMNLYSLDLSLDTPFFTLISQVNKPHVCTSRFY